MADCNSGAVDRAADLHAIVRIGDAIRGVVDTARAVNLAALNAMLSSRRGGGNIVGFRVATSELRGVSTRLMDDMEDLTVLVSGMVNEVALRQRKRRNQAYFGRVQDGQARITDLLADIAGKQGGEVERLSHQLRQRRRELGLKTIRALRLCDQGQALSRSALIEAAYGGESAPVLKQVAEQLALSIRSVADTLDDVRGELEKEAS
ncbi:hypothetical protein [Thiobacillus sp.]|uniref:hypothetical protein n=1 Tax=Thiobacillus sp. TaxID=924 RepID=UPI00180BEE85|nr:hypothetical protein [Thiobacillus sp.]MBC2731910.1 hypothetical protein [Thiobacillus sp.]MBC2740648.1 hypothetical protein [Thiobacillus sp.]MBC2758499.1 hypothetical protein [Thiobacillus sp.]